MKTFWCKNEKNPSDRISHAWAPLIRNRKAIFTCYVLILCTGTCTCCYITVDLETHTHHNGSRSYKLSLPVKTNKSILFRTWQKLKFLIILIFYRRAVVKQDNCMAHLLS